MTKWHNYNYNFYDANVAAHALSPCLRDEQLMHAAAPATRRKCMRAQLTAS